MPLAQDSLVDPQIARFRMKDPYISRPTGVTDFVGAAAPWWRSSAKWSLRV